MLLLVIPCLPFVFWPAELFSFGDAFLAYNGTMYAPISGILFVDYFFLRGQRLNLWSIFDDDPSGEYHYTRGFHWPALGSLVLGQALYLFMYNPITHEIDTLSRYAPASVASCVVPGLTYWLAMGLLARRRPRPAIGGVGITTGAGNDGPRLIAPNI